MWVRCWLCTLCHTTLRVWMTENVQRLVTTWNSEVACCMLLAPHISRTECMLNWAQPTSMVAKPSFADIIGPIVLPHGESLRTTKSWQTSHTHQPVVLSTLDVTCMSELCVCACISTTVLWYTHTLYSVSQKLSLPPKLFVIFSLVVNQCKWKLSWLLHKHIPTFRPTLIHLSEYLYELYHFY